MRGYVGRLKSYFVEKIVCSPRHGFKRFFFPLQLAIGFDQRLLETL
jgi:hypothetical protein